MSNFSQYVASLNKNSFSMLGKIPKAWGNMPKETIAGLEFPLLKSIVARETWFKDHLINESSKNRLKMQSHIYQIALKLKKAFSSKAPEMLDSQWILLAGSIFDPETMNNLPQDNPLVLEIKGFYEDNSVEISEWVLANVNIIQELADLAKDVDDTDERMLLVTFFVASRVDPEWELEDTSTLPMKDVEAIANLFNREMLGNVEEKPESEDLAKKS